MALCKKLSFFLLCLSVTLTSVTSQTSPEEEEDLTETMKLQNSTFNNMMDSSWKYFRTALELRKRQTIQVGEQVMINQFRSQQRVRSEGNSGLVSTRRYKDGYYSFHSHPYNVEDCFASFHDHNTFKSVVGIAEIDLTLNGIHFTTKHMDYRLIQPHRTVSDFGAFEAIDTPEVPDTVDQSAGVIAQAEEMIEYFRAFKEQDESHRPYKQYFKPILCYLEGMWLKNYTQIRESTSSWVSTYKAREHEDMLHKRMIASSVGVPYESSNRISDVPRTILEFDEYGNPIFGQWYYRILCSPLKEDLPTKHLRLVDDLMYRVTKDIKYEELFFKRAARFKLDDTTEPSLYTGNSLLDKIFADIPGADNGPVNINEKEYLHREFKDADTKAVLNAGMYNHRYYDDIRDIIRQHERLRGFADENMYIALNTRPEVAGLHVYNSQQYQITDKEVKFSYAIPLEIIYLTPLDKWNPYNITYPVDNVRNGLNGDSDATAWTGSSDTEFARTPTEFYKSAHPFERPSIDSVSNFLYVKDASDTPRKVAGTGIRTITSLIARGVNSVRLRYPLLPLHSDGSPIAKDLDALKLYTTRELEKVALSLRGL